MTEKYSKEPILSAERFQETLNYIATQAVAMAKKVLDQELSIDTLTIFTKSNEKHAYLDELVRRYGSVSSFSHGATLYINSDLAVRGNHIRFLGLREPDDTRPEVGYADYPVEDYDAIRDSSNPHIHEIASGRGQRLLEVRH